MEYFNKYHDLIQNGWKTHFAARTMYVLCSLNARKKLPSSR